MTNLKLNTKAYRLIFLDFSFFNYSTFKWKQQMNNILQIYNNNISSSTSRKLVLCNAPMKVSRLLLLPIWQVEKSHLNIYILHARCSSWPRCVACSTADTPPPFFIFCFWTMPWFYKKKLQFMQKSWSMSNLS